MAIVGPVGTHARQATVLTRRALGYTRRRPGVAVVGAAGAGIGLVYGGLAVAVYYGLVTLLSATAGGSVAAVGAQATALVALLLALSAPPAFVKAGIGTYVGRDCAPDERAAAGSVVRSLLVRSPGVIRWAPVYGVATAAFVVSVALARGTAAARLPRWPYTALVPATLGLDTRSVREAVTVARERFRDRWDGAATPLVGFWAVALPVALLVGVGILVVVFVQFFTVLSGLPGWVPTGAALMIGVGLAVVLSCLCVAVPVVDGVIYAVARGWEPPKPFDDAAVEALFN